ncbi:uncharacterized protein LOC132718256 [Ruditapes philippinarum]|uniref:uncharacterized protein LOC132718256 n=1 Tax=Ruditapes philippinarum TaxID=129788 RepID=UPI00295A9D7B|nr:uncharacterized protein LOC132718256 [Ruditapes philippinarum]
MDTAETFECIPMEATKITPRIVDVINKRVIGKMIISLCGNEGTEDDENNAVLRRLLLHAISVIGVETKRTLQNAEFKVFDDKCNIYIVLSGKGENKFEFTYNEKLEPEVIIHRKTTIWTLFYSLRRRIVDLIGWLGRIDFRYQVSMLGFNFITHLLNAPTRSCSAENSWYRRSMVEYFVMRTSRIIPLGPYFAENPSTRREHEKDSRRAVTKQWPISTDRNNLQKNALGVCWYLARRDDST